VGPVEVSSMDDYSFPLSLTLHLLIAPLGVDCKFAVLNFKKISVSVSAYTSTGLIIPTSFINTEQSFHSHPNTHAQSRHIAVSSVRF